MTGFYMMVTLIVKGLISLHSLRIKDDIFKLYLKIGDHCAQSIQVSYKNDSDHGRLSI